MSKALIQYQGDRNAAANVAFWVNNALGLVVAGVLVLLAKPIAISVFHDSRVTLVLQMMALQVILSAAASVHTALLQKDFLFQRLFWVRLLTVTVPGMMSIPLAWMGYGYWSLVAGTLTGQLAQLVMLWRVSNWRPALEFDRTIARRLGRFGAWVALSGLLGWFYLWADSLIVGMYLGAHDLGLYRTGNTFVIMVYGFAFGPLLPVLYSHLSSIQDNHARVRQALHRTVQVLTFVGIPTAFLLYALATPISEVVFGASWQGVSVVIAMMGLTHGYAWIVNANGEAYRAIGRPDLETKIMAVTLPAYLLAYLLSVKHGLDTFLWVRLSLALSAICVHFLVARIAIAFPVVRAVRYVAKISLCGLPLVALSYYMKSLEPPLIQSLVVATGAGGCVALFLWLVERRSLIPETRKLFQGKAG